MIRMNSTKHLYMLLCSDDVIHINSTEHLYRLLCSDDKWWYVWTLQNTRDKQMALDDVTWHALWGRDGERDQSGGRPITAHYSQWEWKWKISFQNFKDLKNISLTTKCSTSTLSLSLCIPSFTLSLCLYCSFSLYSSLSFLHQRERSG